MRRRNLSVLALAAALSMLGTATGAVADEGTTVDSLGTEVGGGSVLVSGAATFVDAPAQVANDPEGDATVPGIGADITTATIAKPNPAANTLHFTMNIADAPPALNGAPPIIYVWPLAVNGDDQGFYLEARLVSAFEPISPAATFTLMQDGPEGFATIGNLQGVIDGEIVRWNLNPSQIGAGPGNTISMGGAGGGMGTTTAVPGLLRFNGNLGGDSVIMEADYTVPGAQVRVGIAPADTPAELIPLTANASVNAGTGAFSAALSTVDLEPGDYVVGAQACYGAANCSAVSTTEITI